MRRIAVLSVAPLLACSSSSQHQPITEARPVETVQVRTSGGAASGIRTAPYQDSYVGTVSYPMARVWAALPAAYDSLGLRLTTLDPSSHTIGNSGFNLRRVLGKTPLSKYINCGKTQIDQNADTYDIHLAVLTKVAADAAGATKVTTTVTAAAKPVSFTGDYVRCSSLGRLEERLHEVMFAELERAGAK